MSVSAIYLLVDQDLVNWKYITGTQDIYVTHPEVNSGIETKLTEAKRELKALYGAKRQPTIGEMEGMGCSFTIKKSGTRKKYYTYISTLLEDLTVSIGEYGPKGIDFTETKIVLYWYTSSNTNFRNDLETGSPYKGNRDVNLYDFSTINNDTTLVEDAYTDFLDASIWINHEAVCVDPYQGYEADDMIALESRLLLKIKAPDSHIVIVSDDKDFSQLPGVWQFRPRDKSLRPPLSKKQSFSEFLTQCIVGDQADNIKGCPGVGERGARNFLYVQKIFGTSSPLTRNEVVTILSNLNKLFYERLKLINKKKKLKHTENELMTFSNEYLWNEVASCLWLVDDASAGVVTLDKIVDRYAEDLKYF